MVAGDTEAFEALVLEHQNKVYSLALRMVGNEEDARDMAQEAFIRAFNSWRASGATASSPSGFTG